MNDNPAWIAPPTLSVTPIGFIRTAQWTKFESPHQPENSESERNVIELKPGFHFDMALRDLVTFDRIWLVWWFHRNTTWRPLVLPPRGPARRRGVFATRSPHRPNPIGITSVPLIAIEKTRLIVGNTDLLDGTPILDIKPYLSNVDAFPDASLGWLADVEAELTVAPKYSIVLSESVREQMAWLRGEWQVDFMPRVNDILSRDPSPHRTRRIRKFDERRFQMKCGAWRLLYSIDGPVVTIESVSVGYPDRLLQAEMTDWIPDQAAQIAFRAKWPDGSSKNDG